ncbi:MAG: hypothetical protein ACHQTE_01715, partial [Candidatus Saccharimonadales bacterium]
QQAHDSRRQASATVISSSLEKYFEMNGQYPSVAAMTATDSNSVKQLLGLLNLNSLVAPGAPTGTTTNMWQPGAASHGTLLTYSGNTDASASCLSGGAATDSCIDYKIQYYKEQTNTVETIYSLHRTGAAPVIATVPASAAPSLSAAQNGSNVTATVTPAACQSGAGMLYAFQTRTNDGTWSGYSGWAAENSLSVPGVAGTKFGFQVKQQCVLSGTASPESPPSSETVYIQPIGAPGVPSVANSTAGSITTWSWPAASCPAGTTVVYSVSSGNDYDTTGTQNWWMGWLADQSATSWNRDTSSQGYMYATKIRAKCTNAYATSPWSAESNVSYALRPVSAPGNASGWSYAVTGGRAAYDWYWNQPACGLGTNSSWQWDTYIGDVNNPSGHNLYWSDKGPYNHYWYGANAPSKQDPGWYTGNNLEVSLNGVNTPGGIDVYAAITYRCQNPNTLRSAVGARSQSPGYST